MGWQSDVFPLEMCQSLPSVGEERRELQSLLLLVVNEGPGSLQVASVEVVHRHPRRSRVVVSCSVRIFQRTELVLTGNKKYLNSSQLHHLTHRTHSQRTKLSANWNTSKTNFSSFIPLGFSGLKKAILDLLTIVRETAPTCDVSQSSGRCTEFSS